MTVIYVQRSETATGLGALESTIDRLETNLAEGIALEYVVSNPPKGFCDQYPVADALGNLVYYRGPAGKNVNVNAIDFDIVVNGITRKRPQWKETFGLIACSWGPAGHAAISPTSNKLIHSARVDKNIFGSFDTVTGRLKGGIPFVQEWQLIETDFKLSTESQKTIKGKDNTEPNWSEYGLVWIDKTSAQHYICVNGNRIPSPGLAYDPIQSPNGDKVAWLVLEGKIGSNALENLFNVNWSIYVADVTDTVGKSIRNVVKASPFVLNSHPHWYDNDVIMWSRLYSSNDPWLLWLVEVDHPKDADAFTTDNDGSIPMVWVVH